MITPGGGRKDQQTAQQTKPLDHSSVAHDLSF
jgi:hypothetical protein